MLSVHINSASPPPSPGASQRYRTGHKMLILRNPIEAIRLQRITKSLVIFIAILAIVMLSTAGVSAQGVAPNAPTGLTATPGDQEISLDWDDGVELDLTYNIYRGDATSGQYDTQVATGLRSHRPGS